MFDGGESALNGKVTDAGYFRARARNFRRQAGEAGDDVIHRELLRLAEIYERMAENAEIEARRHAAI
jgi:hypothetical protein